MAHHAFDLWGWYAGEVAEGSPRSTPLAPATLSTDDDVGEPRANWTGAAWVTRPYAAPPPAPSTTPVPHSVTRRQARQALLLSGLLDQVQPAIDAIPGDIERGLAQIEWQDSQAFERDRPVLLMLAGALGLDGAALDDLFRYAATL